MDTDLPPEPLTQPPSGTADEAQQEVLVPQARTPAAADQAPDGASPRGGTHRTGVLAHLRRVREILGRTIDRAEERRQADRAAHLAYHQEGGASQGAQDIGQDIGAEQPNQVGPASTTDSDQALAAHPPATAPRKPAYPQAIAVPATDDVTTRTVLASLPRWLVRGGLGAWLLLGVIIIVSLMVFVTARVVPVFVGLFIALVLTSILQPLVSLFVRVMPRYPATFLALLTALASLVGLVAYVVTSVTGQWDSLAAQFSDGLDTIVDFVETGPLPLHVTQQQLTEQFQEWVSQGQDYLQNNAPSLASEVLSNASGLVDFFAVMALAVFSTIFFLASGEKMWRWFLNELPAHLRESVHRAAGAGWYTFAGYARGTVIVALTDAIMAGIFLQLVGIPLAAPLAVLVFIGAFIPLIGAPVAMVIAMVVALASQGPLTMVVVGLGVAGIGQIEGHILQPLIMGRQVSLHPVVVIIAVAVGTYSAGLLGAIVAVPVISVAWSVYSELHVRDAPVLGELPAYTATRRE
ncbi:AI-2E family transporter [Actinomyces lilanjuaniae]|uniref:AI-2E family transporter n=1 Tax=Actinomyces lilanjuaniae TaxID=2321394 RepID=A0ABN5PN44_9ACTO|nr:AI-2E family transporter [Actinomyces lilanjuaniae]